MQVFINLCRHPADDEDMWGGVFGLIPPLFVASHVKPWRMPETLAVHVLSNRYSKLKYIHQETGR